VSGTGERPPAGAAPAGAAAAWTGGQVSAAAACVLAPNPGVMTLEGTNTWLLHAPGRDRALVVDPGPLVEAHLVAVVDLARSRGARITAVLLTHGHADHSEGAARMHELTGAPVRALDPEYRLGEEGLADGDVVAVDGLELRVLATPGHTGDSLSFLLQSEEPAAPHTGAADGTVAGALLTGDTVLGRGTTVVVPPDGRLADYLASLRRLRDLASAGPQPVDLVLPGHGPVLADPVGAIEYYLAHREQRLEQVRAALDRGAVGVEEVTAAVYADVDRSLWPAAALSVRAQLDYLAENRPGGPDREGAGPPAPDR
jgi:glyoxylase-like metal-dependent hydrolase (beta-lactamase superfamily II)